MYLDVVKFDRGERYAFEDESIHKLLEDDKLFLYSFMIVYKSIQLLILCWKFNLFNLSMSSPPIIFCLKNSKLCVMGRNHTTLQYLNALKLVI